MKSITVNLKDDIAADFKAVCEHHQVSVNKVLRMLVDRVIKYSERLPAALEEFEADASHTTSEGQSK